jgi:hypothetical protein
MPGVLKNVIDSAINALTLKPAECALWLRPPKKGKPNL